MSEQYAHTNSRGATYFLNSKNVVLRGGHKRAIYYFTKDKERLEACALPEGWEVVENPHNGFCTIRRTEAQKAKDAAAKSKAAASK